MFYHFHFLLFSVQRFMDSWRQYLISCAHGKSWMFSSINDMRLKLMSPIVRSNWIMPIAHCSPSLNRTWNPKLFHGFIWHNILLTSIYKDIRNYLFYNVSRSKRMSNMYLEHNWRSSSMKMIVAHTLLCKNASSSNCSSSTHSSMDFQKLGWVAWTTWGNRTTSSTLNCDGKHFNVLVSNLNSSKNLFSFIFTLSAHFFIVNGIKCHWMNCLYFFSLKNIPLGK